MAFLDWSDTFKVGVSIIDTDHKKLVDLINNLYAAMMAGKGRELLGSTLKELVNYTDYHFKNEENLMRVHTYEKYTEHKAVHDDLRKKATDLLTAYNSGNTNMTVQVAEFLKGWILHHISERDRHLAAHLISKGVK